MTPKSRYLVDCETAGFVKDPVQLQAINALDALFHQLIQKQQQSWFNKFKHLFSAKTPIQGWYFWGGVGRGKTYLMDVFCHTLQPHIKVKRMHFHRFMYWIHQQLIEKKGTQDPLKCVGKELAKEAKVLCFDEFYVSEIGDAMILGRLFETLFKYGVVLVTTSNIPPSRLYWKGLHRDRFLPTIDLIQQHTQVMEVDGGKDYRLRALKQVEIYHWPLDENAQQNMANSFDKLSGGETINGDSIMILGREIQILGQSAKVLWTSFTSLCEGPRSAADYIELSRIYPSILLSELPQLSDRKLESVRRFITLIDEFYEHNVKLIISAETAIEHIYQGDTLSFEFRRTTSRLKEMQSESYLEREHIP